LNLVGGPTQINREDRTRQIIVGGHIAQTRSLGDVKKDVLARIAEMKTPEGVTVEISGQAQQMAENFQSLGIALALAVLFIYMVLASQFGSFVQPFTIMLALPLAVIGAFVALLITGKIFDMLAYIGLILLMGLVTKNSILLIDYINQDRRRGMARMEAILSAGNKRLRPILMTSFAMILGMLPVALAFGTSSEFRVSMAVTVIGGLVSSTMLTLVVIPVVYTILDDLTLKVRGKSGRVEEFKAEIEREETVEAVK
jgi:HAE1 family hydrophobic/amphiphilic exporter-1